MGRGKRPLTPLADRDWPRRVPLATPAPRPIHAVRDQDALSKLLGLFQSGYTSEQITEASPLFERALGLPIVCVWDYVDDWGTGGSSEVLLVVADRHYPLPDALAGALYGDEPVDSEVLATQLAVLEAQPHRDSWGLIDVDEHNQADEDRR